MLKTCLFLLSGRDSASVMLMALLVLLVGKKLTGLTSFFLGLANVITSVFTQVYFYLACGGCLREEVEKSFGTMFTFDLSIVLDLLIGIFYILSGLKAFFKLVASFLKMILVLPLLASLTVIAVTKSFAELFHRKVKFLSFLKKIFLLRMFPGGR